MKNSHHAANHLGANHRWRTCTFSLSFLLVCVHSFQVPSPAFLRKPHVHYTFSRVPIVVPSKEGQQQTLAIPPLLSTSNSQNSQESDENSLYQPQPGEKIDSSEPVQVDFSEMYPDMPKADEILGTSNGGSLEGIYIAASVPEQQENTLESPARNDDKWFEPIKREIEERYARIRLEMIRELDEQRRQDPDSIPDNADLLMETVWQLEMEEEIEAEREKAAKALLEEYESQGLKDVENRDLTGTENSEVARKLQEELRKEQEQRAAQQARIDEFLRYEQESFQKAAQKEIAEPVGDLDTWALERLEDMLASTREEDVEVADNLQANIEELRSKIEKEQRRGSIQPETLKEWQIYRAIATRMLVGETEQNDEELVENEAAIAGQLESWKVYQQKERDIRQKSGLSRGPKLPFDWHEAGPRPLSTIDLQSPPKDDKRSRKEVRADVNQKSIEILEGLLESSLGTPREASIRQNLEDLKAGLEEDLAKGDEEDLLDSDMATGPVDVSDVFVRVDESRTPAVPRTSLVQEQDTVATSSLSYRSLEDDEVIVDRTPPNTPFFSHMEDDFSDTDVAVPQRPNTPFFSDDEIEAVLEPVELDSSKLGTVEEQKLQRMYRRAGAVTAGEQARIKKEWEQFQSIEKQKRDISGLSNDFSSLSEADLKYNISEVIKDGDIDADKILSSIGPRPTRTKKRDRGTTVDSAGLDTDEVASDEMIEPLFRSVSAIGGGRTKDDPEAKAQQRSAFEEFVMKQQEVRETLDEIDSKLENKTLDEALDELGFEKTEVSSESLDDKGYMDEVLDSVGARPKRERRLSPAEYERFYSDNGGVKSSRDYYESDTSDDDDDDDDVSGAATDDDALFPPWMRKAKDGQDRELGLDFDDEEHERNMRQLREYEQRRAPQRPRQMGIDLSDVFGRDLTEASDYEYEKIPIGWQSGRSFSGFESRKANLLDYKELDVRELNLLMDTKTSVQTTGVSQYIPRINKPFRDFGAIFRMEGVLLDTTGFEYDAWTKTAETHGYKPPMLEDVKLAAVTRPETAVRKIFFWTDDFLLCKQIARTHQSAMKDVFAQWMKENGITYVPPEVTESREDDTLPTSIRTPVAGVSMNADKDQQLAAWTKTAEKYGFHPPSIDDVLFASVVSTDDAIMNSFRWTSDANLARDIATTYQRFLKGDELSENGAQAEMSFASMASTEPPSSRSVLSENEMLEIQYKAWLAVAQEHELDPPSPDEALGAMVINDPVLVIRNGFAWTDDPSLIGEYVREYEESVRQQVRQLTGVTVVGGSTAVSDTAGSNQDDTNQGNETPKGLTEEAVTEMKAYAWMNAAEKHACEEPMVDDFRASLYTDPEYAVKRIYRWTDDDDKARAIALTYQQELEEMSKEYAEKHNLEVVPMANYSPPKKIEKPTEPSRGELFQAAFDAWKQVAEKRAYPPPNEDQVQFTMTVGPEDGVRSFQWTDDPEERSAIVEEYLSVVRQTKLQSGYELGLNPKPTNSANDDALPPYTVVPGASKWLQSLLDVEMPCGVISFLEREQVDVLLDQSGLARYFPVDKRVTASNGYELESQQMLGAALRVERRPDHCVVFDSSPESSVAAHDVDMKSVSLVGAYPMYELLNADSTAKYLDELTAMNVRRLFGERVYDQPMAESLEDRPDFRKETKTITRFWEEGDRE